MQTLLNKSSLDSGYLHSRPNSIYFLSSPVKNHFKGQLLQIKGTYMEAVSVLNKLI